MTATMSRPVNPSPRSLTSKKPTLLLFALLACGGHALRLPSLAALGQRAQSSLLSGVAPAPSPFALANFEPNVFTPDEHATAVLTLVWGGDVCESQVDALMALAVEGAGELTLLSRRKAGDSIELVVRGSRAAGLKVLQLAAMRNVAVVQYAWS